MRRSAPVLAPSAARIESSPSRRTVRARIRLATFEHAMMKTRPEAARRTSSTVRAPEVIWSRSSLRANAVVRRCRRIGFGMFLHHGRVNGAQFGASLVESGAGSELAEELGHAMDAARDHRGGKMVRAGDDVGDNLGVRGIWDRGFKDADDGGGTIANAAEANGFADDVRIFVESGRPETIGEHDDASSVGAVVSRSEETAEDRMKAHDFEVVAADDAALELREVRRGRSS